ncbi:unnamed protein product [Ixodes pacificus]
MRENQLYEFMLNAATVPRKVDKTAGGGTEIGHVFPLRRRVTCEQMEAVGPPAYNRTMKSYVARPRNHGRRCLMARKKKKTAILRHQTYLNDIIQQGAAREGTFTNRN